MRVLVACEFSGTVRDAFIRAGHDATSCDLIPSETPGPHAVCDARVMFAEKWDLVIAHPPCTYLAASGARWWKGREAEQAAALDFAEACYRSCERVAVENPVGALKRRLGPATQWIQPWQFGHGETKRTGLWLRGLPPLQPSLVVDGRAARVHRESPGPERWKNRSRTFPGIAAAMAEQWGRL